MIEAKMKELSIQKLYDKYPQCNCLKDNPYYMCKDILIDIINQYDYNLESTNSPTTYSSPTSSNISSLCNS